MKQPPLPEAGTDGIPGAVQFAAFAAAFLIIVSRRPDALLHPQFYGEDGAIFFADAYNWGAWKVLFWTYNGYIHILPRLVAALAVAMPVNYAPLIENLAATALQVLPVNILLSARSPRWGSLNFRVALALVYLILPNIGVMMGTLTESQWILALCAFLLLVAAEPSSRTGKILDAIVLPLCSLTGPFCLVLFPLALLQKKRHGAGILLVGSLIQIGALLIHGSSRTHAEVGAGLKLFIRILGGQIYLGTVLGANALSATLSFRTLLVVASIGSAVIIVASSKSAPLRGFAFFAGALFLASLANPIVPQVNGASAWEILNKAPRAQYWFLPSLAFGWSILYCFRSRIQLVQILAASLAFLMVIGIVRDYKAPAFVDLKFADHAAHLSEVPMGTVVMIPQNPDGWRLKLIKR